MFDFIVNQVKAVTYPVSREVYSYGLALHVIPSHLTLVLVDKLPFLYQFGEWLWFPWELLALTVVPNNGASVCGDEGASFTINKDESWDSGDLERLGKSSLDRSNAAKHLYLGC